MDGDVVKVSAPGVDLVLGRLFRSTVGQKALVAVTGALLVAFAFAHMIGHLQMFAVAGGQEAYNQYAEKLQSLGAIKWAIRGGLLVVVAIHIQATLSLMARNRTARPVAYGHNKWLAASLGAQTMRVTGPLLAFFILYHVLHFTVLAVSAPGYEAMDYALRDGTGRVVADVYGRMVHAFSQPALTVGYVCAVGLLGVHLSHGISSLLQTLGMLNATYRPAVRSVGPLLAGVLTAGFAAVPLAILAGVIQ
ncbi:MAG: succinate dehydrogenase cytochrome b subunit [Deltaproteobacteria bacterium]|nr:succinate dehydrogenase cytochrome b subunit [Deltaproteobacteria bacterium]